MNSRGDKSDSGRAGPATVEAVRAVPMFSALDDKAMADLLSRCRTTSSRAGEMIFLAGQKAESFYVILSGKVEIFRLSARGDRQILHLFGPGQTFGEAGMWVGGDWPAHAEAVVDSKLLIVRRDALQKAFSRNAELALAMLAGMSAKLREFAELIEQLSLKDVPTRLAAALLAMAREAGGGDRVVLRQTKRQLAGQIGAAAETLSRALAKLKAAGLIEVRGSQIVIRDRAGLKALAEQG